MKIIYVYDALCGWCYGFCHTIYDFHEKYKSEIAFEVISGGMITGDRIGPIGEVAGYISWAYKNVENATNVKFGDDFLNITLKNGKAIFTSIPSAVAMSVFKKYQSNKSVYFANRLQKAIYYDGNEPNDYSHYGKIAEKFGLKESEFVDEMHNEANKQNAMADFKLSKDLGVTGFPTVFLETNGVYHEMARGYVNLNVLENNYITIKNKLK